MTRTTKRIALNFGGGYVPGLNAVMTGAVSAADKLGWEIVGLRDGYDGLLFPDRYPQGGVVMLNPSLIEGLAGSSGCYLGSAAQSDPFHVRTVNPENQVEEVDRSDALLEILKKEKIEAVISVVGSRALSILLKLSRKGLQTVAVPKSAENDVEATALSFGYNSTLTFLADMLERVRQAARSARKIGVVEVLGENSGWLALQSGIAACAEAVLIPEIPYDLQKVAAHLREKAKAGRPYGLVIVAEGAKPCIDPKTHSDTAESKLKASLSPGATGPQGSHVIEASGKVSNDVALELQRLVNQPTYPIVLGEIAKGGAPSVVDRQLGLGYGAAAVRTLKSGQTGMMVVFQPPDIQTIPLTAAINKVRTVPPNGEFMKIAESLGICLGV